MAKVFELGKMRASNQVSGDLNRKELHLSLGSLIIIIPVCRFRY